MCTVGVIDTVACNFMTFALVLYVLSVSFVLRGATAPGGEGPPQY